MPSSAVFDGSVLSGRGYLLLKPPDERRGPADRDAPPYEDELRGAYEDELRGAYEEPLDDEELLGAPPLYAWLVLVLKPGRGPLLYPRELPPRDPPRP